LTTNFFPRFSKRNILLQFQIAFFKHKSSIVIIFVFQSVDRIRLRVKEDFNIKEEIFVKILKNAPKAFPKYFIVKTIFSGAMSLSVNRTGQ